MLFKVLLSKLSRGIKKGYFKLLRLLLYSSDSPNKVAMGAAFGMFWGLTPTVGLQITGLALQKTLTMSLNKISGGRFRVLEFNLPLAIALTWISNPFTMLPLYFGYYYLGALFIPGYEPRGWMEFSELLQPLTEVSGLLGSLNEMGLYFDNLCGVLTGIGDQVLIPLCLGSLMVALPFTVGAYVYVRLMLARWNERRERRRALKKAVGHS